MNRALVSLFVCLAWTLAGWLGRGAWEKKLSAMELGAPAPDLGVLARPIAEWARYRYWHDYTPTMFEVKCAEGVRSGEPLFLVVPKDRAKDFEHSYSALYRAYSPDGDKGEMNPDTEAWEDQVASSALISVTNLTICQRDSNGLLTDTVQGSCDTLQKPWENFSAPRCITEDGRDVETGLPPGAPPEGYCYSLRDCAWRLLPNRECSGTSAE